jgi:hypothetical protein
MSNCRVTPICQLAHSLLRLVSVVHADRGSIITYTDNQDCRLPQGQNWRTQPECFADHRDQCLVVALSPAVLKIGKPSLYFFVCHFFRLARTSIAALVSQGLSLS